jgi:hypothetical protein
LPRTTSARHSGKVRSSSGGRTRTGWWVTVRARRPWYPYAWIVLVIVIAVNQIVAGLAARRRPAG